MLLANLFSSDTMTFFNFITNKFVKPSKESARIYRSRIGKLQGWVSVFINGILFVIKIIIGIVVGSVSIIADAIHTLSDVISSGVVIWGFNEAEKPADTEHPYGHGRWRPRDEVCVPHFGWADERAVIYQRPGA